MISQRFRDIGPNARDMVADLWSRSGASAAPAQISAPTTSTGQGIAQPPAATAAPTPSQAAAPDSECAGPIMLDSTPLLPGVPFSDAGSGTQRNRPQAGHRRPVP
ncbi:hypothetical protein GCM10010359_25450 [Streptomyces morookaense]|nr:hypothetical protein GCM10010359_25450 [Streptomyces morookaense]